MTPIEEMLVQEIKDRERLDPDYYRDIKQKSVEHALSLGIAPEMVARLYDVKSV